jgi:hypothetical protein
LSGKRIALIGRLYNVPHLPAFGGLADKVNAGTKGGWVHEAAKKPAPEKAAKKTAKKK